MKLDLASESRHVELDEASSLAYRVALPVEVATLPSEGAEQIIPGGDSQNDRFEVFGGYYAILSFTVSADYITGLLCYLSDNVACNCDYLVEYVSFLKVGDNLKVEKSS
nr:unnamed protein product [Fasciola hepatica]